ncbi:hypothetical protein DFH29DRAFT_1068926 [Suillus ampliporus]|nr:hypothetical protein DFH29DRAFT_1068926 [Suillus ampliporus]
MPDQPVVNQELVLDEEVYCAFPSGSLPRANDMVWFLRRSFSVTLIIPQKRQSPTIPRSDYKFRVLHPTMISPNPWISSSPSSSNGYSCQNLTQGQYATHWQSFSAPKPQGFIPQPESIYSVSYPTTANMFTPVSNYGSWHNPPTLHSTQYHDPVLGGTTVAPSSSPAAGSDCWSSYLFPMQYSNIRPSHSRFPYTVTNQDEPFISDSEMSISDILLHNEPSHQWQYSAIHQPSPLSGPLPPMIPPPLAAEYSQISFSPQHYVNHGEHICYPSYQLPANQPYSILLHGHPSDPFLPSCRWLRDHDGTLCGFTGTMEAFKAHCKTTHFAGPQNAQIECRWEACNYHKRDDPTVHVMRRGCMWRHTCEVHLGMKRGT